MRVSTLIQRLRIVNMNKVRGVSLGEGGWVYKFQPNCKNENLYGVEWEEV